ncbi:MAG: hypothetical protein K0S71_2966 [Clostridia bacterium]|jgi:hypothetical protein|nr:hypothetical protein [Clostridia bacterium]
MSQKERVMSMNNRPLKLMALGISIMILGTYVHIEPGLSQNLHGNEFLIVIAGFIISLVGFYKNG